jgi:hypothetical protein
MGRARERILKCVCPHTNWNKKKEFNVAVGMDADEEEVEPVAGKRVRKETALASGKLDKGEPGAKLKKRARVLVEVMANDIMVFYISLYFHIHLSFQLINCTYGIHTVAIIFSHIIFSQLSRAIFLRIS